MSAGAGKKFNNKYNNLITGRGNSLSYHKENIFRLTALQKIGAHLFSLLGDCSSIVAVAVDVAGSAVTAHNESVALFTP